MSVLLRHNFDLAKLSIRLFLAVLLTCMIGLNPDKRPCMGMTCLEIQLQTFAADNAGLHAASMQTCGPDMTQHDTGCAVWCMQHVAGLKSMASATAAIHTTALILQGIQNCCSRM